MKLRPLHDRLLIRPLDAEEKTAGGIIIPDTAKESSRLMSKRVIAFYTANGPVPKLKSTARIC